MPCNDVTEIIRIQLDRDERFKSYRLSKRTCGGAVGAASLIEDYFRGRTPDEIVQMTPEAFHAAWLAPTEIEEFLALKHFFAVQIALEVLTGRAPGGVKDPCIVAAVGYNGDEMYFEAEIPIDLPTEKIRACGLCKRCPSIRVPGKTRTT